MVQHLREVLRIKEQQLEQLQKEIEALRLSLRILEQEEAASSTMDIRPAENMLAKDDKDNGTRPAGSAKRQFP